MSKTMMSVNGLFCEFNAPKKSEHDMLGALPPYARREVYSVDEYPACPDNWMHGSPKASSYFVGVSPNEAMWLDFNKNFANEHHVAIVISIQGINPITGMPCTSLKLEQYNERCPKHDKELGQERYCPECNFKLPKQNYLTTTTTGFNQLWLDGFRAKDGQVRQYVFTEETAKGVASQLIGENRVFAIGVAFFLSKEPKPKPKYSGFRTMSGYGSELYTSDSIMTFDCDEDFYIPTGGTNTQDNSYVPSLNIKNGMKSIPQNASLESAVQTSRVLRSSKRIEPKKLEIGAGKKIQQVVADDTHDLSFWQESPAGMIYINYTTKDIVEDILKGGKRKEKEGFLEEIVTV